MKIITNTLFQFHEGPIKTQLIDSSHAALMSFNSMKVRLKPGGTHFGQNVGHVVSIP